MIGKNVSHYRVLEKLGSGGMGVVYKAEDTKLGRTVALKFLPPELTRDEKAKQRFIHEAQAASAMEHSNICTIYEVDETEDGRMFICMAYYEGKTLKDEIEEGELDIERAVDITIQIAHGLVKAHAQGIIHRDIKPANVFITNDDQVKILDFGLAKLAGQLKLTTTGKAMGTAAYMSPEQVSGEDVGPRTDIWALGVILHEMATGRLPFLEEYEMAVMYSIVHEEPETISSLRPGVPAELEKIVNKAMAKKQAERYQNAGELLTDLGMLKRKLEFEDYSASRTWQFDRGARKPITSIALFAVLAAAIAIIVWLSTRREDRIPGLPGQPLQVTSGKSWEGEPTLSPDGERIAYASDIAGNRDIFVIDVRGGNPLQLTSDPASDTCPTWYPDGSALAFVSDRRGRTSIWKVSQLGGGATLLLSDAVDPAVSPDGERIAFSVPSPGGDFRIGMASLSDPTAVTMLTGDEDGVWSHRCPAWSPDGRMICYATQHDLWIVPSTGGRARKLSSGGNRDYSPAWSSNGKLIYFSSRREGTIALWRIAAAGGIPQRLTMGTGSENRPTICADGSRFAYATQVTSTDLFIRDLDSGEETKMQGTRDDWMAAMAPDKSVIVYASDRMGSKTDLWIQPLDQGLPSGSPRRLTDHPGIASHPVFSPDGTWLAYYRIIETQRDIWTLPLSGGRPIRFTEHEAEDIQPAWSPDGSALAFVSSRGGYSRIWIASVSEGKRTSPPRPLTGEDLNAYAPTWSRDGKTIAFVGMKENLLEVWTMPADGKAPARQITSGATAFRVRWDPLTGAILASGTWGGDWYTLRRVSLDGKTIQSLDPPVVLGREKGPAGFDVSSDGRLMVFCHEEIKGNIWVLEAEKGIY